jgi:hypothetical protein
MNQKITPPERKRFARVMKKDMLDRLPLDDFLFFLTSQLLKIFFS